MQVEQMLIMAVLFGCLVLFLGGRWRHDVVALAGLLVCVVLGLVPAESAFMGFGHPAVIAVACVLVLSYGLQLSGTVDVFSRFVLPRTSSPRLNVAILTALAAFLSAFMNNVGALALLMPIGLRMAKEYQISPGKVLMPLAFGSILGGTTTLIGTPPNLLVSSFRELAGFPGYGMFDFFPVGVMITIGGCCL